MRRKKTLPIVFTGFLGLLVVFIYLNPFAGNIAKNTRFEGYARSIGIKIKKKSPPLPNVASGQTHIPVIQSTYCWGSLGCADYADIETMLQGVTPITISPKEDIVISFDYKPAPNSLIVRQYVDGKSTRISLQDGYFHAPKEKGIYKYGISADFSKGDTSSAFVIEIR
ncbi:hypothetical protein I8J29_09165 [Paenibacillus sp. MWE-103]|uniref:Uncharacterized protein n=1 Tax=Paenibacillus artemisiicola TaxID=1172618 RepID=A0ABS3W7S3_9BACL|nr:hypothetical protein [Paenibacillus artemisiicola]MBO7744362.1 hypothetical protein [Paenibacillus artemisiicola]